MKVIEDCDTLYEYRQQFSAWHFDAWQPDEPYMLNENFATVKGNWETELESMQTVGLKGEMDEYRKKATGEAQKWGNTFDRYYSIQDYDPSKHSTLKAVAESFGLGNYSVKVHLQKPGQMSSWHLDKGMAGGNGQDAQTFKDNAEQLIRIFVMLNDYSFGQMMQFGNRVITHWRKGQCIFFRWQDLPHCTANCGHSDRWLMHVTGIRTEKFDRLLSNPNQTIQIKENTNG